MTYLDLPKPYHLTREYRAIRAAIIRVLRDPKTELSVAMAIMFCLGFAAACQI